LYITAEHAAHCHGDDKRAHPDHYLKKKKPQGLPGCFNFPIGDNERTCPSVTNEHFERELQEFSQTDEVLAYEQKFMTSRTLARFTQIFKAHQKRCKEGKYVGDLNEPKKFFEWIDSARKAKCYLCQADLPSLHAAGPRSKMCDRRNSSADNGNSKKDHTRDNIAYICDVCQRTKNVLPEADCVALCCAVAYNAYDAQAAALHAQHKHYVALCCAVAYSA
jgi:hypothetical protein